MPTVFIKKGLSGCLLPFFPSMLVEGRLFFGGIFSYFYIYSQHKCVFFLLYRDECIRSSTSPTQTVTDVCWAAELSQYWYGCADLSYPFHTHWKLSSQLPIISAFRERESFYYLFICWSEGGFVFLFPFGLLQPNGNGSYWAHLPQMRLRWKSK